MVTNVVTRKIPTFDPYDVKESIIDLFHSYFQNDNLDVYESGFMGYFIQALTHATSDILFENSMAYNEAFLIRAILKSSIYNKATELDYEIKMAIPAFGNLTILAPIDFDIPLFVKIPAGSAAKSGDIPFKVVDTYFIRNQVVDGNPITEITKQSTSNGSVSNIPYKVEFRDGKRCLVFNISIIQMDMFYDDFKMENQTAYKFYERVVSGFRGDIYSLTVICNNEKYRLVNSIYQAQPLDKYYERVRDASDNLIVKFGNGVYGYQPPYGSNIQILLYTTLGTKGNVAANSTILTDRFTNLINGDVFNIVSFNPVSIQNGADAEDLATIKRRIIENISAAKRLVTEKDYKGFGGVTGLTNIIAHPELVRRDIAGNDIPFFIVKFDGYNLPVPATSVSLPIERGMSIPKGSVVMEEPPYQFVVPLNVKYDDTCDIPILGYEYVLSKMNVAPTLFHREPDRDIVMVFNSLICDTKVDSNNQLTITSVIDKLDTMNTTKLEVFLSFHNTLDEANDVDLNDNNVIFYEMDFSESIDDETHSKYVAKLYESDMKLGEHYWRVILAYDNKVYNHYVGTWTIYNFGEIGIKTDDVYILSRESSQIAQFDLSKIEIFNVSASNNTCILYIPVNKYIASISSMNMDITVDFKHPLHNTVLFTKKAEYKRAIGDTIFFAIEGLNFNDFWLEDMADSPQPIIIDIYAKKLELEEVNHQIDLYTTGIIFLKPGQRPTGDSVISAKDYEGIPAMELIHLGLNSIDIWTDEVQDFYFDFMMSKLSDNDASKIRLRLEIPAISHFEDLTYIDEEDQIVRFRTKNPIPKDLMPEDGVTFIVSVSYMFNELGTYVERLVSIYKQAMIFKTDVTHICYSHIKDIEDDDGEIRKYAFQIPAIERAYYEVAYENIDNIILADIVYFRDTFPDYKMLTDKINYKFIKTAGRSKNMLINQRNVIKYNPHFFVELPVPLSIKAYVNQDIRNSLDVINKQIRDAVYTFLQLKAGVHTNIYRSEIHRFIHDSVPEVQFCEVTKLGKIDYGDGTPIIDVSMDIVYNFDLSRIDKMRQKIAFSYVPEYIWFDPNLIDIDIEIITN